MCLLQIQELIIALMSIRRVCEKRLQLAQVNVKATVSCFQHVCSYSASLLPVNILAASSEVI